MKDCNDGILNYVISCHFSKEGLEEYELRDFGLIIRREAEKISLRSEIIMCAPVPKAELVQHPLLIS